jgi:hypothetical protein
MTDEHRKSNFLLSSLAKRGIWVLGDGQKTQILRRFAFRNDSKIGYVGTDHALR